VVAMKKRLGIIAGILGIVLAVIGIVLKQKENTAVSVIGGADGPTSIFIAGKLNGDNFIFMIVVGIILNKPNIKATIITKAVTQSFALPINLATYFT